MLKTAILNWFSSLQMNQIHQTISDRVKKNCDEWFVISTVFTHWQAVMNKSLWCWGIPKAKKTMLTSISINHLCRGRNESIKNHINITVVYLKYNEPKQTLDNLLGSLLRQLIEDFETISFAVLELYDHHRDRNISSIVNELRDSLLSTIGSFAKVFLVVDALDECNNELRWDFVERLETLQPYVHLLITSRYLDSISEELENFTRFEIKAHRADIELFIDHQIKKNRNLRKIVERNHALRRDTMGTWKEFSTK